MELIVKKNNFTRHLSLDDGEELIILGTTEELEALAAGIIFKAKHPDNVSQTYTGIPGILLHIEHMPDADAPPRFHHDCAHCTPLGRFHEFDLYFCKQKIGGPTVIGRYGNEGA
jgi:hypothetical protein